MTIQSGMMDPGYYLFPGDILGQTLYQVSKYPNRDWDWEKISREPTLSQCDIEFLPDKPWDWYYIARNQLADKYLLSWKQQIDSCGVAIDGSPWLPGVGFCEWAVNAYES